MANRFILLLLLLIWHFSAQAAPQAPKASNLHPVDCDYYDHIFPKKECLALVKIFSPQGAPFPCHWSGVNCKRMPDGKYHVQALNLREKGFSGILVSEIGDFPYLQELDLSDNKLIGLPSSIGALSALEKLDVSGNQLTSLTSSIAGLARLRILNFAGNRIKGALPAWIGMLGQLRDLSFYCNGFYGNLPAAWGGLRSLQGLSLNKSDSCPERFEGSLPDSWSGMVSLQYLHIENQNISGNLPSSWSGMKSLQTLKLDGNFGLYGHIPRTWTGLSAMKTLYARRTNICVPVDPTVKAWVNSLQAATFPLEGCGLPPPTPQETRDKNMGMPNCHTPWAVVGNPIVLGTGNKHQREIDYVGTGPFPLRFERHYNSQEGRWRHNFERAVIMSAKRRVGESFARVNVVREDGKRYRFYDIGDEVWRGDLDVVVQLRADHSKGELKGWRLRAEDDSEEFYDEKGHLQVVTQLGGLQHVLEYNQHDQLIGIKDSLGHRLQLQYDDKGRVSGLIDPAGGRTVYQYDMYDQLRHVIYPDGGQREYLYEASHFPQGLTGIIDERGVRIATWSYDERGRAISSEHANGQERLTVEYIDDQTVRTTNALGKQITYTYQFIHGVAKTIKVEGHADEHCAAAKRDYEYDAYGRIQRSRDWEGHETSYTYDTVRGLEVMRTEAEGTPAARTIYTDWHPTLRKPTSRRTSSYEESWEYDTKGQMIAYQRGDSAWHYQYNANHLLAQIDGPREDATDIVRYDYDEQGHLRSITNPFGQQTRITGYDAHGHPTAMIDPNGLTTEWSYHPRGWLLSKVERGSQTRVEHKFSYDPSGYLTTWTLPNGQSMTYDYDLNHQRKSMKFPTGDRIEYAWDILGNPTAEYHKAADGQLIGQQRWQYDALGRLRKSIGAEQQASLYAYDRDDRLVKATDPLGQSGQWQWDAAHRISEYSDPSQQIIRYQSDDRDRVTSVVDPRGLQTSYDYAGVMLSTIQSPDSGETMLSYDSADNVIEKNTADDYLTYAYDLLNRPISGEIEEQPNNTIRWTYDQGTFGLGRLTSVKIQAGLINYRYDERGRVIETSYPREGKLFTLRYSYDLLDQKSSMIYPSGRSINYQRDSMGRIQTITMRDNTATIELIKGISYDPRGEIRSYQNYHGGRHERTYDQDHQLTQLVTTQQARRLQDVALSYTPHHLLAKQDDRITGKQTDYSYDPVGRLIKAYVSNGRSWQYQYDAVGNRLSSEQQGSDTGMIQETYDYATNSHHLLSMTQQSGQSKTRSFVYAEEGHVIKEQQATGSRTYQYDGWGRLRAVNQAGKLLARYEYDDQHRRIAKKPVAADQARYYHYDEAGHLLAESDRNGQFVREYIYLDDLPVAMISANKIYYLQHDHLGSPYQATDEAGQIVWQAEIAPFGKARALVNTIEQPLRFPGQYEDAETGLHYNWRRYYDPDLGRYLQSDPIGLEGGINTYTYVGGNPINRIDYLGLWSTEVHNKIIDTAFPALPRDLLDSIKAGSADVDGVFNQLPGIGNSFEHAMKTPEQSTEDAKLRACHSIKNNLYAYRMRQNHFIPYSRRYAYYRLGRGIHTIMDSTSPVHKGFQEWRISDSSKHGSFPTSLENSISSPDLQHTIDLINRALAGDDCGCTN